jgi:molybdopterin molybdotransferase
VLTGAPIPVDADTVVAEEFVHVAEGQLTITQPAIPGRNILSRGSDMKVGDALIGVGDQLTPGCIGLLAAGGHASVPVVSKPHVALIATGDEVLLPGEDLSAGKLYASNLLTLNAWCRRFGFKTAMDVVKDEPDELRAKISRAARAHDAIITSGGAWTGDKDLVERVLDDLGWEKAFHRVRLGPGKAAGFGLLNETPVFLLPGGPPSNLVAFLVLTLPGLMKLTGFPDLGLPRISAALDTPVTGQVDWTQAIFGKFRPDSNGLVFVPDSRRGSRLKSMAWAQGLLLIPEGTTRFDEGEVVEVLLLA